jgi:hypothetical protein
MINMGVEIKFDKQAIAMLENAVKESAMTAMEQVESDLISSATMPFDTGDMQNNQTFVAKTDDGATIVTGSPQARRLYYHPEYNFYHGHNKNAGAAWLEPYISGDKKDFAEKTFAHDYKRRTGV